MKSASAPPSSGDDLGFVAGTITSWEDKVKQYTINLNRAKAQLQELKTRKPRYATEQQTWENQIRYWTLAIAAGPPDNSRFVTELDESPNEYR